MFQIAILAFKQMQYERYNKMSSLQNDAKKGLKNTFNKQINRILSLI